MTARVELNGRWFDATEGRDLLSTCLENGVDVPHFCWHGALGSVGACRLCAVRVYSGPDDTMGRIEMSCMTPVRDGMRVEVEDAEAGRFRAHVIEWLMLNHPHDCAVCEEGGACHLQDMTVATGHRNRRSDAPKRTHARQDLGPFLTHEMNRCIACYRCVRFYRDYAGGTDFNVFGAHDRVWFGRAEAGALDSPFAGNLAEICPTGVFDDKQWSQHYARPWDMTETPAICTHCSVGCNITLHERAGTLRKVQNRYHGAINGFFLCDRGRFGPWFVDAPGRITAPRQNGTAIAPDAAIALARQAVADGAIGIGSPRASLEANFALRELVGPDRFFAGVSDAEAAQVARMLAILQTTPASLATIKDFESADAALILGEDLTATAPRAALALRQAARGAEKALAGEKGVPDWLDQAVRVAGEGRRSPIAIVTPLPDALDDAATRPLRRAPDQVATFGFAIAAALRGEPSDPEAQAVAQALAAAHAPLLVSGIGLSRAEPAEALASIAAALGAKARIALFPAEANSFGLALLSPKGGLESALAANPAPLIVLENDLYHRADSATVNALLSRAPLTIALDCLDTATTARAALVLPVASMAEATGTYINNETRAQRSLAARRPTDAAPAAWRVLAQIGGLLGDAPRLDDVLAALAARSPALAGAALAAPPATALPAVARAPESYSGRTAHDLAGRVPQGTLPHQDPDSGMGWSMEGLRGAGVPPALSTGPHRPGMHSVSAAYAAQTTIGGPLKGGDPGVLLLVKSETQGQALTDPTPNGDGLRWLPLHSPFAATETDLASPPLAARAPAQHLLLHPDDATRLGLTAGAQTLVDGQPCAAPVTLDAAMPRGWVGLTAPRGRSPLVTLGAVP